MRRIISFYLGALAVSGAAVGQNEYSPPPVGTMVTWSFGGDEERQTRLSEVVATGPDYTIFLSDLRLNKDYPASYVVEFSGIHVTSCSAEMPSDDDRAALRSAWPLKSGKELQIKTGQDVSYEIGKLTSHILSVGQGPIQARQIKANFGSVENDIKLSLDWNMAVSVSWPDGSGDSALEIVPPSAERPVGSDLAKRIGKCADLLLK